MSVASCPACRKALPVEGAAFCPYCGAPVAPMEAVPAEIKRLMDEAAQAADPVKKHKLLLEAREKCPDCLAVERELLHLGRLYERNPKRPSYDVIKCHLLHFYLTPKDFSPERKAAMRDELFEHEQLRRCQSLAPDAEQFTREYLERLCGEFIQLFLEGSTRYTSSIFGFSLSRNLPKQLAAPAAEMLAGVWSDENLPYERRAMLASAFFKAFSSRMGGDTEHLLARLGDLNVPVPEA